MWTVLYFANNTKPVPKKHNANVYHPTVIWCSLFVTENFVALVSKYKWPAKAHELGVHIKFVVKKNVMEMDCKAIIKCIAVTI